MTSLRDSSVSTSPRTSSVSTGASSFFPLAAVRREGGCRRRNRSSGCAFSGGERRIFQPGFKRVLFLPSVHPRQFLRRALLSFCGWCVWSLQRCYLFPVKLPVPAVLPRKHRFPRPLQAVCPLPLRGRPRPLCPFRSKVCFRT